MASVTSEEEEKAPQHAQEKPQQEICSYQGDYGRIKKDLSYKFNVFLNLSGLDLRAFKGELQPNQKDLSFEPNYYGILRHQRYGNNWNWCNINVGYGVIEFLNRSIPDLPYMEPSRYGSLQSYLWRPGLINKVLETPTDVIQCTSTHRIRRILSLLYLPKLSRYKPQDFPFFMISHQISNGS
ncbi:unnamed protein product [Cochlearia groenlandica]